MCHLSGFLCEFRVFVFPIKTERRSSPQRKHSWLYEIQTLKIAAYGPQNHKLFIISVGLCYVFESPNTFWWNINLSNVTDCSQFVFRHTNTTCTHTDHTKSPFTPLLPPTLRSVLCSCYRTTNTGEVRQLSDTGVVPRNISANLSLFQLWAFFLEAEKLNLVETGCKCR